MVAVLESPPSSIGLLNYPECTFAVTGLIIPPGMSFERWEQLGSDLRRAAKGIQFWIGDWIRYGEHEYGEKYAQAIEATGQEYQTLANYVFVAEHVDFSRRRENVPFSIHAEVASLPAKDQERILAQAAEDDEVFTVRDARKEARRVKRKLRQIPDEVDVLHAPAVQSFLDTYIGRLDALMVDVPREAGFLRKMIDSHKAQASWQKGRTVEGDCEVILEAVEELLGPLDDILMWLTHRGYFIDDPDLKERLDVMCLHATLTSEYKEAKRSGGPIPSRVAGHAQKCECLAINKLAYKVKQGGRKDTQRGDMVDLYHPIREGTGDSANVPRANSIYDMGERE